MNKILSAILTPFTRRSESPTTTQMRMITETRHLHGLRAVRSIPLFGNKSFKEQYRILMFLLIPFAATTVCAIVYGTVVRNQDTQKVQKATQLQMLSQRTARLATQVANGERDTAGMLTEAVQQVRSNFDELKAHSWMRPTSPAIDDWIEKAEKSYADEEAKATVLVDNAKTLSELRERITFANDAIVASLDLMDRIRVLQLDKPMSSVHNELIDSLNASLTTAQQMAFSLNSNLIIPKESATIFSETAKDTKQTLAALLEGSNTLHIQAITDTQYREKLLELKNLTNSFSADMNSFSALIEKTRELKKAAFAINANAETRLKSTKELTDVLAEDQTYGQRIYTIATLLALLSASIGFFWLWLKLQETRLTSARIDESMDRLMDDMIQISHGNLTVRTPTAEDITGTISDSLNVTVAKLNRTLSSAKESSQIVRRGAEQMTSDAAVILEAVRDQAAKIKDASTSVNSIADSVQAIAFAAEQSSGVAQQQQSATRQGGDALRAALDSMTRIRDQIQDTAKRVKRVGESAQEIDEIIELISETTEQTNVLAMNASIQAAAAGEQGRGFRAVATEVQRLAERSDRALRRIVALVRSVQSDTQNAVSAMELSTQEVVQGAETTQMANDAFIRIEQVSAELTSLIQAITEATQAQTEEASTITERISEILAIADNTARGVEQTTSGIQIISELAEELDDTMGNFKL